MDAPFLVYKLHSKRDVVLARDWARQVAALFGFDPLEQACVAAGVFEIARQGLEQTSQAALHFQLSGNLFQVFAVHRRDPDQEAAPSGLRLEKTLPLKELPVAAEDVAWIVCQRAEQTPTSMFREIHKQNQELLYALAQLQEARAQAAPRKPIRPAA
jgi:hypothetical protein